MAMYRQIIVYLAFLVSISMIVYGVRGASEYMKRWGPHGGHAETKGWPATASFLYPRETETREVKLLDGLWNFRLGPLEPEFGFENKWFAQDLSKIGDVMPMPVPSSYNDITEESSIRDHVGVVWYDRRFFVPNSWMKNNLRVWLRFSSVYYAASVWVNGELVMQHEIGHLPFEQEISSFLKYGESNLVTVACDNTLLADTVPQGVVEESITQRGERKLVQSYSFDFFNYAGIHRSVFLYTTPQVFIKDFTVNTDVIGTNGVVSYNISYVGSTNNHQNISCVVKLLDKGGNLVKRKVGLTGVITVPDAHFWWPHLMNEEVGYLYTIQISLKTKSGVLDVYREKIGIRKVSWSNKQFLLNNVPIYMKGFGKHEDFYIKGKGLDLPLLTKDYNLMKWIGANTYRTSHYPYSEESYYMADAQGIMIIDECPSVNTEFFMDKLLEKHKDSLTQLFQRDKNHPSVVMWSIANEPKAQFPEADPYFEQVAKHIKAMDRSRPISVATNIELSLDHIAKHLDIISFNSYFAWYSDTGNLDIITGAVLKEARAWHGTYNKPVLMSEYGADSLTGLHSEPSMLWSEEYQADLMSRHFKAFDQLREEGFFVGEFIWNFADFNTGPRVYRVGGNKKGLFTRDRQPKASAHHLRKRYLELAKNLHNATLPDTLYLYTSNNEGSSRSKSEL